MDWVKDNCNPARYKMYVTYYGEIILAPTKSTRTLEYGYIDTLKYFDSVEEAVTLIAKALPDIKNYSIEKYDWDSSKSVKVHQN